MKSGFGRAQQLAPYIDCEAAASDRQPVREEDSCRRDQKDIQLSARPGRERQVEQPQFAGCVPTGSNKKDFVGAEASIGPSLTPDCTTSSGPSEKPDDGYAGHAAIYDLGLRGRQSAGLAALLALASSSGPDESGTVGRSRWSAIRERVAVDHMLRNSLYLMLNSILQAGFGFAFWIITARLFTAISVGQASSLLSATTVIAYLSLLGLNTTFGRYLPTASNRDALITTGLFAVAVCGTVLGLIYALLTPVLAPSVDFVAKHPLMTVAFALLTAAAAVNLLTDSVFVASRRAGMTALVDGGIGGVGKIVAAVILVGTGAWGLYCASAIGIVLSVVASLLLIVGALRARPTFEYPLKTLRPWMRFSGANYIGNVLYLAPTLAVPVIVLDRLGAAAAAYYFIAFQIASSLFAAALAVEQTFLAEGSQHNVNMRDLRRRSGRTLAVLCVPASIAIIASGHWLLLVFGRQYYEHAGASLTLMALAAGPVAMCNWSLTLLRLAGKLRTIVLTNLIYALGICVLAWIGASHGVTGVAAAWPIGTLIAACVARIAAPRNVRPRHRMARSRRKEISPGRYRASSGARLPMHQ